MPVTDAPRCLRVSQDDEPGGAQGHPTVVLLELGVGVGSEGPSPLLTLEGGALTPPPSQTAGHTG